MPKYDDIEHEGTEDFNIFQNRQIHKKIQDVVEKEIDAGKEKVLSKLQDEWMNLDNPFLWEGDPID